MTRKGALSSLVVFLLLCTFFSSVIPSARTSGLQQIWALIVCGSLGVSFSHDTMYMYKILTEDYSIPDEQLIYLSVYPFDPGVDDSSTLSNVGSAIRTTLASWSDENDIVFMYFSSHGGGYNVTTNEPTHEWLSDVSGDEGDEHMQDGDWVGCDECIQVNDGLYPEDEEWYLDDDLAEDLDFINCAKLIFVRQGCVEGNQSCFGGGLIDDISGPKRIIMSASNETGLAWGDMDDEGEPGDGLSEWSEVFMDALHETRMRWDFEERKLVDTEIPVNADTSNDGNVSMWEAWKWALDHDDARLAGLETPWLDDNFNGEPTYIDESDDLDQTDGLFSMETYFGFENLKTPDIKEDGEVNILDLNIVSNAFGSHGPDYPNPGDPPSEKWNPLADLNNDNHVNIRDLYAVAKNCGKTYSDPPSPVSTKTIIFTHPIWAVAREGETFSVNIAVFNVANLRGWEFKLYWNNTVLKCTGAEVRVPDAWGESVFEAGPGVENDFNATHGSYWRAVSALYPAPPFNGSMVFVTLTFEATTAGRTKLDLQETILGDNEAHAIPHIAIDALVTVRER